MSLVLRDDEQARDFAPFSLTRPGCELRAGAELVRRRWEIATGLQATGFISAPHLYDFDESWAGAPTAVDGSLAAGTVVVNSRCAVELAPAASDVDVWYCADRVAAVRLAKDSLVSGVREAPSLDLLVSPSARSASVDGWWMDDVWDFVRHLSVMLMADIPAIAGALGCVPATGLAGSGEHEVFIDGDVHLDPFVAFDTTSGPILIRRGATVHAFTRLVGPCVIGEHTVVNAGRIATSSIGEVCRVHGELSTTIMLGHSNKGHDGFIGHSVLGRWVNLGASTVNSNLKNTYGQVALWTPRGVRESGMPFLGTFFGDHAKTAIGTRLTTGTVVGAGANVFGDGATPKMVPPFAWGASAAERWALDRFLVTASRVMKRRDLALSERARRQLSAAWDLAAGSHR